MKLKEKMKRRIKGTDSVTGVDFLPTKGKIPNAQDEDRHVV